MFFQLKKKFVNVNFVSDVFPAQKKSSYTEYPVF
jgi:hypothetical protein